jgi:hypothetical protein
MKLELEHLAPYLPYNLEILFEYRPFFKCYPNYFKTELLHPSNILIIGKKTYSVISSKPKLRPLSDLTKEIEVNGEKFVPCEKLLNIQTNGFAISLYKDNLIRLTDGLQGGNDSFWSVFL